MLSKLSQGDAPSKWQNWDLNPGPALLAPVASHLLANLVAPLTRSGSTIRLQGCRLYSLASLSRQHP